MLFGLAEGQFCLVPVETRYGVNVIDLHRRIPGQTLPFEMVRARIGAYLAAASWRRGVSHYTGLLIADAEISGIDMEWLPRRWFSSGAHNEHQHCRNI